MLPGGDDAARPRPAPAAAVLGSRRAARRAGGNAGGQSSAVCRVDRRRWATGGGVCSGAERARRAREQKCRDEQEAPWPRAKQRGGHGANRRRYTHAGVGGWVRGAGRWEGERWVCQERPHPRGVGGRRAQRNTPCEGAVRPLAAWLAGASTAGGRRRTKKVSLGKSCWQARGGSRGDAERDGAALTPGARRGRRSSAAARAARGRARAARRWACAA
jgi:hypothetical protein